MGESDKMRQNAETCAELADAAGDAANKQRFKRMEKAWDDLALTQDWLDGEKPPAGNAGAQGQDAEAS